MGDWHLINWEATTAKRNCYSPVAEVYCVQLSSIKQSYVPKWKNWGGEDLGASAPWPQHRTATARSRIEVRPTTSWPWPVTFSFNPLRAMVVNHTHAKDHDQRLVGSKDRMMETNGRTDRRTDGGDCITSRAKAVGNNISNTTLTPTETCRKGISSNVELSHQINKTVFTNWLPISVP